MKLKSRLGAKNHSMGLPIAPALADQVGFVSKVLDVEGADRISTTP
jgi:hypothetical protein